MLQKCRIFCNFANKLAKLLRLGKKGMNSLFCSRLYVTLSFVKSTTATSGLRTVLIFKKNT